MSGEDDGGLRIGRRRAVIGIVVAAALAGGALALIGGIADYHRMVDAVRSADARWLPVCVGGLMVAYVGYILAYRDIARVDGGPELPYRQVTQVVVVGLGATAVGASAGGLAVDFWALHRAGLDLHDSARRVLALNTLEWAALGGGATLAAIAVLAAPGEHAPPWMTVSWIVAVPACVAIGWWVSRGRRGERLSVVPEEDRDLTRSPRTWAPWAWLQVRRGFADAIGGLKVMGRLVAHPLRHAAGLVGFPVYWGGQLIVLAAALRAFGATLALSALVLAFATAYVASALPLPAGGAGGIEAAMTLTLHQVGIDLATAVVAVLVYRLVTFWAPIGPALLTVPRARRLSDELPEAARAPA